MFIFLAFLLPSRMIPATGKAPRVNKKQKNAPQNPSPTIPTTGRTRKARRAQIQAPHKEIVIPAQQTPVPTTPQKLEPAPQKKSFTHTLKCAGQSIIKKNNSIPGCTLQDIDRGKLWIKNTAITTGGIALVLAALTTIGFTQKDTIKAWLNNKKSHSKTKAQLENMIAEYKVFNPNKQEEGAPHDPDIHYEYVRIRDEIEINKASLASGEADTLQARLENAYNNYLKKFPLHYPEKPVPQAKSKAPQAPSLYSLLWETPRDAAYNLYDTTQYGFGHKKLTELEKKEIDDNKERHLAVTISALKEKEIIKLLKQINSVQDLEKQKNRLLQINNNTIHTPLKYLLIKKANETTDPALQKAIRSLASIEEVPDSKSLIKIKEELTK